MQLQDSVCIGYDVRHPGWPKIGFVHFDPFDLEKYVEPEVNLSVSAHMSDANLVTVSQ